MSPQQLIYRLFLTIVVLITLSAECYSQSEKQPPRKKSSKLGEYRSRSSSSSGELLKDATRELESNPEAALDKVEEALAESIAQDNAFNEARSYILIGDINARISEWKMAAQNYERAYTILKTSDPLSDEFKRALNGLAKANLESGNIQAAENNYNELLTLKLTAVEKLNVNLALSEVQYRMGNYDKSMKLAHKLSTDEKAKLDPATQVQQQNMIAKNYARKNDVTNTNIYLDSSLTVAKSTGGAGAAYIEETKNEVASTLRDQGRLEDEIALRNKSIEFNSSTNNLSFVAKDKVELSKTLEAKGARSEALKELVEAADIAGSINDPREQANAYLSLAGLYEKNGQSGNALTAYRKYSEAVKKSEALTMEQMEVRSRLIRKQTDIEDLSKELYIDRSEESEQQALIARQRIIIISLVAIVLLIGVTSAFIYRSAQSSKRANQLLALKSLRSQMNPHFIFNALNSVNHFIAQQDERTANKFLSEFSQLMRLVLENSQEDFITLQKEQEILALYMKLEHYRFRDKFDYVINLDPAINIESIQVPPMLIQPYIENAVWHGLRYRESKGYLELTMDQKDGELVVRIVDNGIGRKKSAELKTDNQKKHKSTGLKNIKERLTILNNVYKKNYRVMVTDGPNSDGEGTIVEIRLPV